MAFIELRNIAKTYRLGEVDVPVLDDVSLTIERGEFVALMGASGSGKTTLMNILGCLDRPSGGQYWLDGQEVGELSADERALLRNQKIGFVFQTFNLLARTSALDNVLMPLTYTPSPLSEREARQRAEVLLQRVGLGDRLGHQPAQLSGGQQQRVAIARALINQPALLFADEPTGNLDSHTSEEVLRLFQQLNEEEGVTIILVTHDEHVAQYAKRTIRIRDGAIVTEGTVPTVPEAEAGTAAPAPNRRESQGSRWARFRRLLRTALTGLRRNVLRAALTTLGIIIGVAAVIAMMEIGRGSASAIQRTIASMGANNLIILPLRDAEFGPVRLRAFGTYAIRIADATVFLRQIVGTDGRFTTDEITEQLRDMIVARFSSVLGESRIPILDLAANYDALSKFVLTRIAPDFQTVGLELATLLVENISLPKEVEEALDRRTSMGIVGNLEQYTQFQAAEAMRTAAANPGGGGEAINLGLGLAMGRKLGETLSPSPTTAAPATGGPTPPPVPAENRFFVAVNGQQNGPFSLVELQQQAGNGQLTRASLVWAQGMAEWTPAGEVDRLSGLFAAAPPPLPKA